MAPSSKGLMHKEWAIFLSAHCIPKYNRKAEVFEALEPRNFLPATDKSSPKVVA